MINVGRPSKYKPEYCQQLIKHMSEGLSMESFAALVGVNRDTLYEWNKTYSEFADVVKEGTALSLLYWEKIGVQGMIGQIDKFNASVYIFNMKNRFKWRDKQPDEAEVIVNNVAQLSDEELDARIKELFLKV